MNITNKFLFLAAVLLITPALISADTGSASVTLLAPAPLREFAGRVVDGNRSLLAAGHELESSLADKQRALADFSPQFNYTADSSKSANRSFNSVTGFEEDYSTRRHGGAAALVQKTPLGRISYEYSQSKTEYTSSQSSYFRSIYLGWQTGLLRNDARVNALDRRLAHAAYSMSEAQTDSVLLDVLLDSLHNLFDRIVTARNEALKKQNTSFYATLVEEAEIKLNTGIGSELDLKQASMRLQQAETGNEEIALALRDNDRSLASRLGHSAWDPEMASFPLELVLQSIPEKLSVEDLLETALVNRPDWRVYESQHNLQRTNVEKLRELSRPDLSAQMRWGKQGRSFDIDSANEMPDKNWDVSVAYSFSFGPEAEKLNLASQRHKLKAFEERMRQKRADIIISVTQTFERFEFYLRNLVSLKASQKLSAEVLDGQRLNFQLGKVTLLDLTRYQQDFDNASLAVVQGESRLITEWLRLLYETGTLAHYLGVKTRAEQAGKALLPIPAETEEIR
ncbi:MAG: hypothetical protein CVV42_08565 [Candidatus Riflebacteria bacterium HGW-Riflebacteria-2]|nr:MAG: hypothetical protein CVV42_08565 [Candidatus Riflebacteria bacterium HGW-Riflebacteria-2]